MKYNVGDAFLFIANSKPVTGTIRAIEEKVLLCNDFSIDKKQTNVFDQTFEIRFQNISICWSLNNIEEQKTNHQLDCEIQVGLLKHFPIKDTK